MVQDKTSGKSKPGSTSRRQIDTLQNFECSLPLADFPKSPKNAIKSVKAKPQRKPAGPTKAIQ